MRTTLPERKARRVGAPGEDGWSCARPPAVSRVEYHRRDRVRSGVYVERGITAKKRTAMATDDEMKAELERLKAENAALKARGSKGVSMKVSEKGAVSVYGLGRFPVTLYQEQWLKLLELAEDIRGFIRENEAKLKKKE
jgi:hypothetical protein